MKCGCLWNSTGHIVQAEMAPLKTNRRYTVSCVTANERPGNSCFVGALGVLLIFTVWDFSVSCFLQCLLWLWSRRGSFGVRWWCHVVLCTNRNVLIFEFGSGNRHKSNISINWYRVMWCLIQGSVILYLKIWHNPVLLPVVAFKNSKEKWSLYLRPV